MSVLSLNRQQAKVQWFGSHPSEPSPSMRVYREYLYASCKKEDRFEIRCWPRTGVAIGRGTRTGNIFGKYFRYALRVAGSSWGEIVHFLDHSSGYLVPWVPKEKKVVVTLHDLIPLRVPIGLSDAQLARFRRSVFCLQNCDAIITVSNYSKNEAIELLKIDEEKIHVVPNGVAVPEEGLTICPSVKELR